VTQLSPGPGVDPRASDPTVAYDAVHATWLASSLGLGTSTFQVLVSRSPNGIAWSRPVTVTQTVGGLLDKEWIACDNWPSSPNRGRCYVSYLDVAGARIVTQASVDGGLTWSAPVQTSIQAPSGIEVNGAQPLPRPDGSLVVVYEAGGEDRPTSGDAVYSATSTDGGATFAPSVRISGLNQAPIAGVRAPALPSADVGSDGKLYAAWQDCRFSTGCTRDRIVVSTSTDGVTWTTPVPVGRATPGADQVIPGLAVDPATGHVAAAYYSLPADCVARIACPGMDVWLTTSADAGATWTAPQRLDAQPMRLDWLAQAGGAFVGDYISVSWTGGRPVPVYSLGVVPFDGRLRQAVMALQTG
jgi:hypothetical protein